MTSSAVSRRRSLRAIVALALGAAAGAACAQAFPSKPVKIVPFGTAGGPIDAIARIYGEKLQQRWGQPIVVEAKPGASGIVAADAVAKAPPDGYTVFLTLPLTHINNAILNPKLPYDPVKDFEPLSQLAHGAPALVARADAPYSNLKEFVAYAKALNDISGQVIVFFTLVVAAAEVAVGLAIIIAIFRRRQSVNADDVDLLKG